MPSMTSCILLSDIVSINYVQYRWFPIFKYPPHSCQQLYPQTMFEAHASDVDFYMMKITRLEADLAATQEELMSARLRLRTAEDFQIKYELLLKQSEQENVRLRYEERGESSKISQIISLKIEERDSYWSQKISILEEQLRIKHNSEVSILKEEIEVLRKKVDRKSVKLEDQSLWAFKNKKLQKEKENLEQKIEQLIAEHQRVRDEEQKSIKQSLSTKNREKQETERKIYREKIEQLESRINHLEDELLVAKTKADPEREKEIEKMRREMSEKLSNSGREIDNITKGFEKRILELKHSLDERYSIEAELIEEKKQLRKYISDLQEQIYNKEKNHEIEFFNLKERMSKIREEEAEELKKQIRRIQEGFQVERSTWNTVIEDKEAELERIIKKFEDEKNRMKDDKAKQINKISELKDRLKQYEGEQEAGETQNLIKSLKQLEGREADFANYENGVTFLDRQLKKATLKVEQKNLEITKLVKELKELRNQFDKDLNDAKDRIKRDKKYYGDKISQLEGQLRDLNDLLRKRQKEAKKREKDLQSEILRYKNESRSYKQMIDEMQRDYNRIAETKKAIETSYREERDRGLTSKSDLTMAKKQKWLQLERQKNQLEVIFKEREQQLKAVFQVEKERLRHERDKLKSENEIQKGRLQQYEKDRPESGNKQNVGDYHKKVATLDLEIALTKNIYNSLMEAKSRVSRRSPLEQMEEDASCSEDHMEIKISSPEFPESESQRMMMSFNPKKL